MQSRCALLGKNGAGKTTFMKLVIGELQATEGVGSIWTHRNLRMAYVAQHSMHHLEASLEMSPITYIQNRFRFGQDKEVAQRLMLTAEDEEAMIKRGNVRAIVERKVQGKEVMYLCERTGRSKDETEWIPLVNLRQKEPYVAKLVANYDEQLKADASGMSLRPTTRTEVKEHLTGFGIMGDVADSKIRRLSGGQRSRLVLAAAMWSKPHFVALDEPTNYLDNDTLAALVQALQSFKHGGVIVISHNVAFVNALCNEWWTISPSGLTQHETPPDALTIQSQE